MGTFCGVRFMGGVWGGYGVKSIWGGPIGGGKGEMCGERAMGWGIYGGGKYRGQGRPWGGGMRGVMGEFCGVRFMRVLWGRALWGGAVGQ